MVPAMAVVSALWNSFLPPFGKPTVTYDRSSPPSSSCNFGVLKMPPFSRIALISDSDVQSRILLFSADHSTRCVVTVATHGS